VTAEYQRVDTPIASAVALADLASPLRDIIQTRTIYAHAAAHPGRRELSGRGPAYAIPISPDYHQTSDQVISDQVISATGSPELTDRITRTEFAPPLQDPPLTQTAINGSEVDGSEEGSRAASDQDHDLSLLGHTIVSESQLTADRAELARWSGERQGELLAAAATRLGPDVGMRQLTHAAAQLARAGR